MYERLPAINRRRRTPASTASPRATSRGTAGALARGTAAGLALAMVLAACGGGGSGHADQTTTTRPEPDTTAPSSQPSHAADPGRPEGAWTSVRFTTSIQPRPATFKPGSAALRAYDFVPSCASGPCDLTAKPTFDQQFSPPGYPLPADLPAADPFTFTYRNGHYVETETYTNSCQPPGGQPTNSPVIDERIRMDLIYRPAEAGRTAELDGTRTDTISPNPQEAAEGCPPMTTIDHVVSVPSDSAPKISSGVKVDGQFSLSATVADGDAATLAHSPKGTEAGLVNNNPWTFTSDCSAGASCSIGAARATSRVDSTLLTYPFEPTAGEWVSPAVHWADPCDASGTDKIIAPKGYDATDQLKLQPLVADHGSVEVLVGQLDLNETPTAQGLAASATDCAADSQSNYAIFVNNDLITSAAP